MTPAELGFVVMIVAAFVCAIAVMALNRPGGKVGSEWPPRRSSDFPPLPNRAVQSQAVTPIKGTPVFLADGTTVVPGCKLTGGMFVVEMPDGNEFLRHSYSRKTDAIRRSKKEYPAEWHKILAPNPEDVRKARKDLRELEQQLEREQE